MTRRVIFVGCARLPEGSGDEAPVERALSDLGVDTRWAVWGAPDVEVAGADLVVLRSPWDYPARREEFLDWCATVPALRNPLSVVRWNTDKSYLLDLRRAGVPTVETQLCVPGATVEWPRREFVVKPVVGVGSRGVVRFSAEEHTRAQAHLRVLHRQGLSALVQPYQAAVDDEGETALVFLGGVFSHAFTKGPALVGSARDAATPPGVGKAPLAVPEPAWRGLAEDALDATAERVGLRRADLLYARIDVVRTDAGEPAVLEVEVTEPNLAFRHSDESAALRFASAVRNVLA